MSAYIYIEILPKLLVCCLKNFSGINEKTIYVNFILVV